MLTSTIKAKYHFAGAWDIIFLAKHLRGFPGPSRPYKSEANLPTLSVLMLNFALSDKFLLWNKPNTRPSPAIRPQHCLFPKLSTSQTRGRG